MLNDGEILSVPSKNITILQRSSETWGSYLILRWTCCGTNRPPERSGEAWVTSCCHQELCVSGEVQDYVLVDRNEAQVVEWVAAWTGIPQENLSVSIT